MAEPIAGSALQCAGARPSDMGGCAVGADLLRPVDTEQWMTVTCPPPSVVTRNPHRGLRAKDINAVWGLRRLVTLNGQHTVQEFKAARAVSLLRSLAEFGVDPGPDRG